MPLELLESPTAVRLVADGIDLFRYVLVPDVPAGEAPRPYLHPVRSLRGTPITDLRPADHPWHHGISVAIAKVGDTNFWGGPSYVRDAGYRDLGDAGTQVHVGLDTCAAEGARAQVVHRVSWRDAGGAELLTEVRSLCVFVAADRWSLGVTSRLVVTADAPVVFGSPTTEGRADAGYGGVFWRAHPRFLGADVRSETGGRGESLLGTRAAWIEVAAADATVRVDTEVEAGRPRPPWFVRTTEYPGFGPAPFQPERRTLAPGDTLGLSAAFTITDAASIGSTGDDEEVVA